MKSTLKINPHVRPSYSIVDIDRGWLLSYELEGGVHLEYACIAEASSEESPYILIFIERFEALVFPDKGALIDYLKKSLVVNEVISPDDYSLEMSLNLKI
ncbi:hypothetical protein P9E08_08715 [Bacillus mojavensis]|uniref:hypothetical protein n=1 Tax=Bacillus mojavensis TaxID=72360 RepID=UPI002DB81C2D|nr:hypothetical protein [Bacillus mojavensis]MEC1625460.1 hypothetical protein [Bacillus mojavensis]